jgi:hypothetical protein
VARVFAGKTVSARVVGSRMNIDRSSLWYRNHRRRRFGTMLSRMFEFGWVTTQSHIGGEPTLHIDYSVPCDQVSGDTARIEYMPGETTPPLEKPTAIHVWDFTPELCSALEAQLKDDEQRWGKTWLQRTRNGQSVRFMHEIAVYAFDWLEHREPMPWLKIIGNAMIAWIRETHPELSPNWAYPEDGFPREVPDGRMWSSPWAPDIHPQTW